VLRPSRERGAHLLALRLRFLVAADQLGLLPAGLLGHVVRTAERKGDADVGRLGEFCAALLDRRRQHRIPGLVRIAAMDEDGLPAARALRRTAAEGLGELCQQAAQQARKGTGSYYTPRWVADLVAKECVRGLLDARKCGPEAASSLRTLDPAAGAGALLIAIVDAVADAVGEGEGSNDVRCAVVRRCLTGYELDPLAAEACRLSLWLVASRPGRPAVVPARAILVRDTLADPPPRRRYDIVIGNPPWGVQLAAGHADGLAASFPDALGGHRDSFLFFLALAAEAVRSDGALAMVLPDAVLSQVRYEGIRRLLLHRFRPLRLDRLGKEPFPRATAPACALCMIGRRIAPSSYPVSDLRQARVSDHGTRTRTWHALRDAPLTAAHHSFVTPPPQLGQILSELGARHRTLGESADVFRFHDSGINYPNADLGRSILYTGRRQHPSDVPITRGRDFLPLTRPERSRRAAAGSSSRSAGSGQAWLRHDWQRRVGPTSGVSVREDLYRAAPKLLLRQTGDRPVATIDRQGVHFGRSVIAVTGRSEDELLWLAAVMNSSTFGALYRTMVPEAGRPFAQVKVNKLKLVPLPPVGEDHALAELARQVLRETDEERRRALLAEIDERVARAYGLSSSAREYLAALAGPAPAGVARRMQHGGTS